MAGVWTSDERIPNRDVYHDVSRDGLPDPSHTAMSDIRRRMQRFEHGTSDVYRSAKVRRAREDLVEVQQAQAIQ